MTTPAARKPQQDTRPAQVARNAPAPSPVATATVEPSPVAQPTQDTPAAVPFKLENRDPPLPGMTALLGTPAANESSAPPLAGLRELPPSPSLWQPFGRWGIAGGAPVNIPAMPDGSVRLVLQCVCKDARAVRPDPRDAQERLDAVAAGLLRDAPEFTRYRQVQAQVVTTEGELRTAQAKIDELHRHRAELVTRLPVGVADLLAASDQEIRDARGEAVRAQGRIETLHQLRSGVLAGLQTLLGNVERRAVEQVRREAQEALELRLVQFLAERQDDLAELARLSAARVLRPDLARLTAEALR